jgi:NAD(P)-dependent dehydrogenase (short-subunit alcohol dehydrogenase family)
MGRVEGKVALITGAGRGMGASHASVLAREGADVILIDSPSAVSTADYAMSTKEDPDPTVSEVEQYDRRAIAVEGYVRSQADLDSAVEQGISEFGKIDFWSPMPGCGLAPITEMTEEQWQDTVDINLTGEWRAVKAVASHMIERGQGSIVLISSISGLRDRRFRPTTRRPSTASSG